MNNEQQLLCPSADSRTMEDAVVIGIVGGTADRPHMQPLSRPEPVTPELVSLAAPHHITEVFRLASPCRKANCKNFGSDGHCKLAELAANTRREVNDPPPFCRIRPNCLWWNQEGFAACRKCPEIVTNNASSRAKRDAAIPSKLQADRRKSASAPQPSAGGAGAALPVPVNDKE